MPGSSFNYSQPSPCNFKRGSTTCRAPKPPGEPSHPYVVRVELAVPGQRVEQALDVGFEDAVNHRVVRLVQVLPQPVPEVEGDFHNLGRKI